MGRLVLVRHAQASFLQPNYDKLSELGETQARLLGEYWVRHKVRFDRVCSGPCVRQKDTAGIVRAAYRAAGIEFPEPAVLAEFDEYSGDAVMQRALPGLLESDAKIQSLHHTFKNAKDSAERHRTFQKIFEAVIVKWVSGELNLDALESWGAFCARVHRGFSQFLSAGGTGERLAIFTSGGPVSLAVHRALDLSPQNTLRVSWMAQNCSYSEFLFSKDRFTMSTFNSFPHLDDSSLQSYR
jgi:broad specificity phosphatase PhoE